jgi:hypothetical protein
VGEELRLLQLMQRNDAASQSAWTVAFRLEAVKRCVLLAMIVFVITLRKRVAEILLVVSFLVGWILNPPFNRVREGRE